MINYDKFITFILNIVIVLFFSYVYNIIMFLFFCVKIKILLFLKIFNEVLFN